MERTCILLLLLSTLVYSTLGQGGGSSEVQVVGPADPVIALAGDDIIIPCSLKPNVSAEEMTVKWTRLNPKAENVHLYRDRRDSNEDQSPSYSGRTSMFNEELKNGNVSLKLTRVTLSDAGSYRCFIQTLTSQVKETTVQLLVDIYDDDIDLFNLLGLFNLIVPTPIPSPAVPVLSMSLPRLLCSLLVGSPYLLVTIILLVKYCRSRAQGETRVPRKTHQDQLGDHVEEE
ncbi:myelin-oligodendrocyte glycoprotein isoform X5 [Salmo salar]|uniref:Myelin-oligodendrocyte glycoprotein isoform X5 n=1 Tax=Salmo salar TaxID=8030 RepID=A0ABM3E9G4_SALSA|nr:myelin-oligodendrocyte glycoprotein-like isoform X5 [Salmo salar]